MKRRFLLPLCAVALLTAGSAPAYAYNDNIVGTGIGAALGGLLGSQIAHGDARIATTAAGVFVGGLIGNNMSGNSRHHARRSYSAPTVYYPPVENVTYYYPPVRQQVAYIPNYVAPPVQPVNVSYDNDQEYCREYTQQVRVGNRIQDSYGTACLQPDGSWRIVQ